MAEEIENQMAEAAPAAAYTEDAIQTLSSLEHIRRRPGMYIGRMGDGSHHDDGIYILLNGQKVAFETPFDALAAGIGMVHQEFSLIPGFTATENILLNREPKKRNVMPLCATSLTYG